MDGGMGEMGGTWRERGVSSLALQSGVEPQEVWSHSAFLQHLVSLLPFLSSKTMKPIRDTMVLDTSFGRCYWICNSGVRFFFPTYRNLEAGFFYRP